MARRFSAIFLSALVAVAAVARADREPIEHEYLPPDAGGSNDLVAADDASGSLPAAIRTPSGTITPPDLMSPSPRRVYAQGPSNDSLFQPDRDTRRPPVESYDDPFTPQLTPFKRLYAYDAVREDYTLYVRDDKLRPLRAGGLSREGDDRFFADMSVQLIAGEPVRIPTVGPGARLLSWVLSPPLGATLYRDGADNWFVQAPGGGGRVRLVADIAIEREAFASEFSDASWRDLPPLPIQPARHQAAFAQVARAIGISRQMRPRQVVAKMVAYFRGFAPSDAPPPPSGDIYLDLALSKKGVCRHRAFAFLVTALNIGIPARLIANEAHAWVEVKDDRRWHRIDLGGAAQDLQQEPQEPHPERPPYQPPPDQFAWPAGRDSGEELARRQRREDRARAAQPLAAPGSANDAGDSAGAWGPSPSAADANGHDPFAADRSATSLSLDDIDRDLFRGKPMHVRGRALADGAPCGGVRVDILLRSAGGASEIRVGSLSTDERGIYDGAVVLPEELAVGSYDLSVATPGNARCGAASAQ